MAEARSMLRLSNEVDGDTFIKMSTEAVTALNNYEISNIKGGIRVAEKVVTALPGFECGTERNKVFTDIVCVNNKIIHVISACNGFLAMSQNGKIAAVINKEINAAIAAKFGL